MLKMMNIPASEHLSEDFSIRLNGQKTEALSVCVSAMPFNRIWSGKQRPVNQSETASVLSFAADEPVCVELFPTKAFETVTVRPLSEKIYPEISNVSISFTLSRPGQYVVELDGPHGALHIFMDPTDGFDVPHEEGNTLYFGAGTHHIGQVELLDGATVYIDRDAVVYGSFYAAGAENISILGNGVLCGSMLERGSDDLLLAYDVSRIPETCYESPQQREQVLVRLQGKDLLPDSTDKYIPGSGSTLYRNKEHFRKVLEAMHPVKTGLHFYKCKNVAVNGIICRDSAGLSNTLVGCENVVYDNVKIIGMWRYNSDGINFYNCRNCKVKNTFVRAFDDGICMKGLPGYDTEKTENILVENCILWNDWGQSLEIGVDTVAPEICDIIYRDCDCIHHAGPVMDIGNQDRALVHDVLFEDIRVEYSVHDLRSKMQQDDEDLYVPERDISPLIWARVDCNLWSADNIPGNSYDITFRNIEVFTDDNMQFPAIELFGKDETHTCRNFVLENIRMNGKKICKKEDLNLKLNEYVKESEIILRE